MVKLTLTKYQRERERERESEIERVKTTCLLKENNVFSSKNEKVLKCHFFTSLLPVPTVETLQGSCV